MTVTPSPQSVVGRLADRAWRPGDDLPEVGSRALVSGANADVDSDQHRAFSWRTVVGYGAEDSFVCLQTEGCWPTIERTTNCWFAEIEKLRVLAAPVPSREGVELKVFPPETTDVQSRYVIVHQLRASADIQDDQTKRETGWATTSDRARLMRKAADAIESLAALTPRHEAPAEGAGELIQRIVGNCGGFVPKGEDLRLCVEALEDALRARSSAPEAREETSAEDEAEHFIQAAINSAPEPLKKLGEFLTALLDEADWATAEGYLLALATQAREGDQPVAWVSPGQFAALKDKPYNAGEYLPVRKTSAGQFTMGLYTHPAAPSADKLRVGDKLTYDMGEGVKIRATYVGPDEGWAKVTFDADGPDAQAVAVRPSKLAPRQSSTPDALKGDAKP